MSYSAQGNSAPQPQPPPPHSPTAIQSSSDSSQPVSSTVPPRPGQPVHKRTYQACIPCRQRKVRCDLGSVEAPHDPPCVRCRRESKECFFSATRRKRTPSAEIPPGLGRGRGIRKLEDGLENGDTKRARTLSQVEGPVFRSPDYCAPQQSPTLQQQPQYYSQLIDPQLSRQQPLQPPPLPPSLPLAAQQGATTTETLLQTEVYNSHEALLTLIEAAGKDTPMDTTGMKSESRSPSVDEGKDSPRGDHTRGGSSNDSQHHSPTQPSSARWNQSIQFSAMAESDSVVGSNSSYTSSRLHRKSAPHASPKTQTTPRSQPSSNDNGMEKALKSWNKFRFVKAGWFTAREAIGYVEYFYNHLHPLSPSLTSPTLLHVSHPRYHHLLLCHEPFLATTILTVSSRYMTLPGTGGQSRSFAIHDMLWREVRSAFERLMWGGGWGGLGVPRPVGISNLSTEPGEGCKAGRGLRTIGTVEGLLILTEWHVRGLHFPMDVEESDWGIDISDDEDTPSPKNNSRPRVVEGLGDKIENILEPAYRSDRMSWMLLGNALALAYELGIFDESEPAGTPAPTPPAHHPPEPPARLRSRRLQRLLLVYMLQLASRLGWANMIPRGVRDSVRHKRNTPPTPGTPLPSGAPSWKNPDELQDAVFTIWVDLTMLMNSSSELLFPSRLITKQIMRSGQYVALLEHFRPLLKQWRQEFQALNLPAPIRQILLLEYEHVRFYVYSLALQAVIDRCSQAPHAFKALYEMSPQDVDFISEVVDASRSLLSTVVEEMFPAGYLKHAPVRIYLRILSASMFLLKTFALGAKEVEVKSSMDLIDAVCAALRHEAVDDVHLGLRFADLLGGLVGRVKSRFVKLPLRVEGNIPVAVGEAQNEDTGIENPDNGYHWNNNGGSVGTGSSDIEEIGNHGSSYDTGWGWGNEDWLALPLDPILGFEGVTQGTMGVDVGGMDLLEVLLAPSGG